MKQRFLRVFALVLIALCLLGAGAAARADAGNFSGGSDYGGGSSSWSGGDSSWDSGSSSWGSGSTYYDDGTTSSGSGCLGGNLFTIAIIAIVVIVILRYKKSGKQGGSSVYQAAAEEPGLPLETLKQKDPNFNEQAFLEKVGNWYIQMQDAWEQKRWEPMRAIMTDALYSQMERQLQELISANRTNHVDRVAVLDARIVRYAVEGDNDVLVVRLSTRICDYTTDDKTGQVVAGSTTRELFMEYDWKLIRQKDQLTREQDELTEINCENCGAPLKINHSGQCPYCGSIVTLKDHDWALSVIKGISQRSSN